MRQDNVWRIISLAVPLSIELTGIIIVAIGIATEIVSHADYGNQIITLGSLVIAVGSLIWAKILSVRRR